MRMRAQRATALFITQRIQPAEIMVRILFHIRQFKAGYQGEVLLQRGGWWTSEVFRGQEEFSVTALHQTAVQQCSKHSLARLH